MNFKTTVSSALKFSYFIVFYWFYSSESFLLYSHWPSYRPLNEHKIIIHLFCSEYQSKMASEGFRWILRGMVWLADCLTLHIVNIVQSLEPCGSPSLLEVIPTFRTRSKPSGCGPPKKTK